MQNFRAFVWLTLLAAVASPGALAEGSQAYYGAEVHPAVQDAYVLLEEPLDNTVDRLFDLPAAPVSWARPSPLSVAAPIDDNTFAFDLYFESGGNGQTVNVTFGYFADGSFTNVTKPTETTLIPHDEGSLSLVRTTYRASHSGSIATSEDAIPAGAYPAVQIEVGTANSMYLNEGTLAMRGASSSTIPLPELPAWVLLGSGLAVIAGIAVHRRPRSS